MLTHSIYYIPLHLFVNLQGNHSRAFMCQQFAFVKPNSSWNSHRFDVLPENQSRKLIKFSAIFFVFGDTLSPIVCIFYFTKHLKSQYVFISTVKKEERFSEADKENLIFPLCLVHFVLFTSQKIVCWKESYCWAYRHNVNPYVEVRSTGLEENNLHHNYHSLRDECLVDIGVSQKDGSNTEIRSAAGFL